MNYGGIIVISMRMHVFVVVYFCVRVKIFNAHKNIHETWCG